MKLDKKLLRIMTIIVGVIIFFIIIIAMIVGASKNRKYTIEELDQKLITLTKNYYKKNEDSLPKLGKSTSLSAQAFIDEGKIKKLELKTGETCSGEISVTNNNNYYLYIPKLVCGSTKPTLLSEKITSQEKIITNGYGLYSYNDSYIFRGENVNNYLSFANKTWQILRVNTDGTIRIIENTKRESVTWDDRYNIDKETSSGINDYVANNINSRIKDELEKIYLDEKEFKDEERAYFINHDLCIGKRSGTETINDGSIECSNIINNQIFGLIQINEYLLASLDPNCTDTLNNSCLNYNFLAKIPTSYWSITGDSQTTDKVYKIQNGIYLSSASNNAGVKIVAHLSKDVLYNSGTGTLEDPYIIK